MKLQRKSSTPKQEADFKLLLDSVEASLSHTLDRLRLDHKYDQWQLLVGSLNHLRRAAIVLDEPELVASIRVPLAYAFLRMIGHNKDEALHGLPNAVAQMTQVRDEVDVDGLQNAPGSAQMQ